MYKKWSYTILFNKKKSMESLKIIEIKIEEKNKRFFIEK
jgi:hypothetical protein